MHLADYKKLILENSYRFIGDNTLGIVLKTPEEIGKSVYGVYVPRMMMGLEVKDGPYENSISSSNTKCLNSVNTSIGEDKCISSNFIHLTMDALYNLSMPILILGEEVTVGIIDQDIKSMYIKPYCRDQIANRPYDIHTSYVPASGGYLGDPITDENSYFVRMDSKNKSIRLHMSKANGEAFDYDIHIDGNDGFVTITDQLRQISINSPDDEIILKNEANSTIALRKNAIDISCEKFYLKASDSMKVESPKAEYVQDNISVKSKEYKGEIDSFDSKGNKYHLDYTKYEMENTTCTITSPKTTVDGLLTVTGFACVGGIGFGAPPSQKPLPVNPQVSAQGVANFVGPAGVPLVKGPQLSSLLMAMCAMIDTALLKPPVPLPPMASLTFSQMSSQLLSIAVKG